MCVHMPVPSCSPPAMPCTAGAISCGAGTCDGERRVCVACASDAHCGPGLLCEQNTCKGAKSCGNSIACAAAGQICDLAAGLCVDCTADSDCSTGQRCADRQCLASPNCSKDSDCPGVCDSATARCVDCRASADCPVGAWCDPLQRCRPAVCQGWACTAATEAFACRPDGSGYLPSVACSDGNPCTSDGCAPPAGCFYAPTDAPCTDAKPCTQPDHCVGGVCAGGPVTCSDGNACTTDSCGANGLCVFVPVPAGSACSDGQPCTSSDACDSKGLCLGTPAPGAVCDDGNPCTTGDTCGGPEGGCQGVAATGPSCDDNNPCTKDSCVSGQCVGSPEDSGVCGPTGAMCVAYSCQGGQCVAAPVNEAGSCGNSWQPCMDAVCKAGACVEIAAKTGTSCQTSSPCSVGACDAGTCTSKPTSGPHCDDGNPCTSDDACQVGACVGKPLLGDACSDGNPCTTDDQCASGKCSGVAQTGGKCSDSAACYDSVCQAGACVAIPQSGTACYSGKPCTVGVCQSGACQTVFVSGKPCQGKDSCQVFVCSQGSCLGTGQAAPDGSACSDDEPCTNEACVGGKCLATATVGGGCNDFNPCTLEACQGGKCANTGITTGLCDAGGPCWEGVCQAGDCLFAATVGKPCDDSNPCTIGDVCQPSKYCMGQFDDTATCGNPQYPCQTAVCKAGLCLTAGAAADGIPCNDSSGCTGPDTCKAGICQGEFLNGAPCYGNACTTSSCQGGLCVGVPGGGFPCDDNNVCTLDLCQGSQCVHVVGNDGGDCGSEPCRSSTCTQGICLSAVLSGQPCDAGSVCLVGTCDGSTCIGVLKAEGSVCDDGNPCSFGDVCSGAKCQGVLGGAETVGTSLPEFGAALAARPGGGWLVGGRQVSEIKLPLPYNGLTEVHAAWVASVSAPGAVQWQWSLDSPQDFRQVTLLAAAPDGGALVAGDLVPQGLPFASVFSARVSPTGTTAWLVDTPAYWGHWRGATVLAGGDSVVVGDRSGSSAPSGAVAERRDPGGKLVWTKTWGITGNPSFVAVAALGDVSMVAGTFAVTAAQWPDVPAAMALGSDGSPLWKLDLANSLDEIAALAVVDGVVIGLGRKVAGAVLAPVVVFVSPAGQLTAVQSLPTLATGVNLGWLRPLGIAPRPGGGVIAGYQTAPATSAHYALDAAHQPVGGTPVIWNGLTLSVLAGNGTQVRGVGSASFGFGYGDAWLPALDANGNHVCP